MRTAIYRTVDADGQVVETPVRVVNVLRGDTVLLFEALEPETTEWLRLYGQGGETIVPSD